MIPTNDAVSSLLSPRTMIRMQKLDVLCRADPYRAEVGSILGAITYTIILRKGSFLELACDYKGAIDLTILEGTDVLKMCHGVWHFISDQTSIECFVY